MPARRLGALPLAIVALLSCSAPSWGQSEPRDVFWKDLVPPSVKLNLARRALHPGTAALSGGEGRFMERRPEETSQSPEADVVTELDGHRVRIGGYVVPLDFTATVVDEFLLIPYVGACVHVPAPPANQIIHVTTDRGITIQGPFDPVIVTGTIRTTRVSTGIADAGYSLLADTVKAHRPYQD